MRREEVLLTLINWCCFVLLLMAGFWVAIQGPEDVAWQNTFQPNTSTATRAL
jgi:hypothetical protein